MSEVRNCGKKKWYLRKQTTHQRREKMKEFIDSVKHIGEQEAISRKISSLNFDIQKEVEGLNRFCKKPKIHINNIRKALLKIEELYKHLDNP